MVFHVRITRRGLESDPVRLDLSAEELEERFLAPYRSGRPIVIGGTIVPPQDLARIQITETELNASQILPIVRANRANSRAFTANSDEWRIAEYGDDVTDSFITTPPGVALGDADTNGGEDGTVVDTRRVFVVHGRNLKARNAMFTFLRAIKLEPIEWNEAVNSTGKASPYIGEVLDQAFRQAAAILVLMTPDDEARLKEGYRGAHEPPHEIDLTGQTRANVLFEAGMAIGRDENRTVLVEVGHLRPFSDIFGRHVVRMNGTSQRRQELAQRLISAGCAADTGGLDWHTAGDFDHCLDV